MSESYFIGIISDTHFRVRSADRQAAYTSDAHQNDRNLRVAKLLRARNIDLVIHLGDMTHPLPRVPGFEDKDRGYFPRVGLIDRRSNPRPAVAVLRRLMSELVRAEAQCHG